MRENILDHTNTGQKIKVNTRWILLQSDNRYDRYASGGLWLITAAWYVLLALGMPSGIGRGFDILAALVLHVAGIWTMSLLTARLLKRLPLVVPRIFIASLLYSGGVIYAIMYYNVNFDAIGSLILTLINLAAAVLGGWLVAFISDRFISAKPRLLGVLAVSLLILPAFQLPVQLYDRPHITALLESGGTEDQAGERNVVGLISGLTADNPALPGSYQVQHFTYGNGRDKHRPEYGEEVALISNSVDASSYIQNWNSWRTAFWGFDESSLPLNGRVWMPEGDGKYPLVLIVHGNHTMEKFSDDGYAYLGELLASRGMIAVSIDQNFLNYSHWSGIPEDDYKLRTWHLLQHIKEFSRFNQLPDNPFYDKVDLQNIALIGHSRGGQAAAMAADAERWFTADDGLPDAEDYQIQAVIAIAPTDVNVEQKAAELRDVYYLTIYGAKDADVHTLKGDEQYSRAYYTDPQRFKSALFIENANHSYFNSSWGPHDIALPQGLFLNRSETMSREAQESVTKLYVSALLEIVFHERREYVEMFRDYRTAEEWLSDESRYASRFLSGGFEPLADFEYVMSKQEARFGSVVSADGFDICDIAEVTDKEGAPKGTKAAVLEWQDPAEMAIELSDQYWDIVLSENSVDPVLTLSIMNAQHDMELSEDVKPSEEPSVVVELVREDSEAVSVPLAEIADLDLVAETQYTLLPWLEDRFNNGKYEQNITPVFQTVEIPFELLDEALEEEFAAEQLERIVFYFDDGPARMVLDDIGFYDANEL